MTISGGLHSQLIGQPGSRALLNTPALVLDLASLHANVARMAAFGRSSGLAIRPHAKSHKSADIAHILDKNGLAGHCCAKLGEAEMLAAAGIGNLLITSPIVTEFGIKRLVVLICTES